MTRRTLSQGREGTSEKAGEVLLSSEPGDRLYRSMWQLQVREEALRNFSGIRTFSSSVSPPNQSQSLEGQSAGSHLRHAEDSMMPAASTKCQFTRSEARAGIAARTLNSHKPGSLTGQKLVLQDKSKSEASQGIQVSHGSSGPGSLLGADGGSDRGSSLSRSVSFKDAKAKERFLGRMSHELRTPLNGVLGVIQLLQASEPLTPDQAMYLEIIRGSTESLQSVLSGILSECNLADARSPFTQEQSPSFSLRNCVAKASQLMLASAAESGVELLVRVEDDVPDLLQGDSTQFFQLLCNLMAAELEDTQTQSISLYVSSCMTQSQETLEFDRTIQGAVGMARNPGTPSRDLQHCPTCMCSAVHCSNSSLGGARSLAKGSSEMQMSDVIVPAIAAAATIKAAATAEAAATVAAAGTGVTAAAPVATGETETGTKVAAASASFAVPALKCNRGASSESHPREIAVATVDRTAWELDILEMSMQDLAPRRKVPRTSASDTSPELSPFLSLSSETKTLSKQASPVVGVPEPSCTTSGHALLQRTCGALSQQCEGLSQQCEGLSQQHGGQSPSQLMVQDKVLIQLQVFADPETSPEDFDSEMFEKLSCTTTSSCASSCSIRNGGGRRLTSNPCSQSSLSMVAAKSLVSAMGGALSITARDSGETEATPTPVVNSGGATVTAVLPMSIASWSQSPSEVAASVHPDQGPKPAFNFVWNGSPAAEQADDPEFAHDRAVCPRPMAVVKDKQQVKTQLGQPKAVLQAKKAIHQEKPKVVVNGAAMESVPEIVSMELDLHSGSKRTQAHRLGTEGDIAGGSLPETMCQKEEKRLGDGDWKERASTSFPPSAAMPLESHQCPRRGCQAGRSHGRSLLAFTSSSGMSVPRQPMGALRVCPRTGGTLGQVPAAHASDSGSMSLSVLSDAGDWGAVSPPPYEPLECPHPLDTRMPLNLRAVTSSRSLHATQSISTMADSSQQLKATGQQAGPFQRLLQGPQALKQSMLLSRQDSGAQSYCRNSVVVAPEIVNSFRGLSILVVEDNLVNQIVLQRMLKILGLACDIANNGAEAVAACAQKHYDIVFMDCNMPVMDGYEATKTIRESSVGRRPSVSDSHACVLARKRPRDAGDQQGRGLNSARAPTTTTAATAATTDTTSTTLTTATTNSHGDQECFFWGSCQCCPSIVAVTANALQGDETRCKDSGMNGFVPKPVRLANIVAVILSCVDNKPSL